MLQSYSLTQWVLRTSLLLVSAGAAFAQAPVITSVIPMANARAAARTSQVVVSFSQPLTAASAGGLKVFSRQRGGLRTRGTTPAVVSGNALSFAPTAFSYLPGETVQYTVTTAAASSGGPLAQARVGQFTVATGGTGAGYFQAAPDVAAGSSPYNVTLADVDGDGDLDLLTALIPSSVSVRLNNGSGSFSGSQSVSVSGNPSHITAADVDNDGDLDLVAASFGSGVVSVRLNDGSGNFSGSQTMSVNGLSDNMALGDINGDGYLDLVVASAAGNRVATVRLNNGAGVFYNAPDVSVGGQNADVALGDVDGDNDLDMVVANNFDNTVSVRLNDGNANFSGSQEVAVGNYPHAVALADVDGDDDLDLLTANSNTTTVSIRLNNGSGVFAGNQEVSTASPWRMAIGDVDGDGDLDLLTVTPTPTSGTVSVRLNNGAGIFSGSQNVAVSNSAYGIAVGDLDGDGDLDFVTASYTTGGPVSVRLNQAQALATAVGSPGTSLTLFPNPTRGVATLSGAAPNAPIRLLDYLGRTLLAATADATGTARLVLPAGCPPGLYLVRSGAQVYHLTVE